MKNVENVKFQTNYLRRAVKNWTVSRAKIVSGGGEKKISAARRDRRTGLV